ncbi:F-box domain-containing protein [Plasmodiophora brassicae]|uniref:F-box domain-containing protein n=1 Tax=Plasmodiophora brassicae TaxID=37360 RepID=A0A0G4IQY0_PLABS|nr:hypothetical protein PBRA_005877 [Plasmodiophora brassicae]SPQ98309.1 unnamed protein product [Plasmodiophora brassicae]
MADADVSVLAARAVAACADLERAALANEAARERHADGQRRAAVATLEYARSQIERWRVEDADLSSATDRLCHDADRSRAALQTQHAHIDTLASQLDIQNCIVSHEADERRRPEPATWPAVCTFLGLDTLAALHRVCKAWRRELLRSHAYRYVKRPPARVEAPTSALTHNRYTLVLSPLDTSSYICAVERRDCTSCRSGASVSEGLTLSLCERESSPAHADALTFCQTAIALDGCVQEMASDTKRQQKLLSDIEAQIAANALIEQEVRSAFEAQGKVALDLKTQMASDAHTCLFLETHLAALRERELRTQRADKEPEPVANERAELLRQIAILANALDHPTSDAGLP